MTKIEFKNLPDTSTPLSAENLNTMQDNIEDAIDNVSIDLDDEVSTTSTNGVENQAITNYVNGLNTYSTTEQRVGTWINGKPLYRKVVYISSLPNNATGFYDIFSSGEISNIDLCIMDESASYMTITSGGTTENDPMNWIYSTTAFVFTCIRNKQIRIITKDDKSSTSAYVSILYTKTTD